MLMHMSSSILCVSLQNVTVTAKFLITVERIDGHRGRIAVSRSRVLGPFPMRSERRSTVLPDSIRARRRCRRR